MLQACPFCRSVTQKIYCSTPSGTILECMACHGRFAQDRRAEVQLEKPPESSAAINREYFESYADAAGTELEIARNVIKFIVDLVGPPKKVLEVGCGHAQIERALQQAFPAAKYTGIEISKDLFDRLNPDERANVIYAPTLEQALARVEGENYDLVVMHHVLEHLPEPAATLQIVKGKLRPGGSIFIEVPNEQWKRPLIFLRRLLKRGGDDWFPGHINFFTRRPLEGLVSSQGLRIVATKVVPAADLPALVVKMLGGPRAYRKNFVARAVFAVLRATRIERVLRYGISLRCIAQN
jgi:SAM-dependent methyltransferase